MVCWFAGITIMKMQTMNNMKYVTKLIVVEILFIGLTCLCGCKAKSYCKYTGYNGYIYKSYKGNYISDFISEASKITNLNGVVSRHYWDGQMYSEHYLTNNIIQGSVKYWNGNGQIIMHATYTNGLANGVYKTWHDNGVLASISSYSNGISSWDGKSWYNSGVKKSESYWIDKNLKILREKDWDGRGNLIADGISSNVSSINGSFISSQIEGEYPEVSIFTNGVLVRRYYYNESATNE